MTANIRSLRETLPAANADNTHLPHEDDDTPDTEAYDQYITAKVMLPRGDVLEKAIVTSRKRDANGALIGRANANPLLDTRVYEVQFSDGASSEYSANVIAENIFATVDDDGYECVLLDEIIDHRCDPAIAITIDDSWITGFNGNRSRRRTSKGWELCVSWKDGSTSWLPLKDLRSSNPLQVADYAIAHNLQDEPAFSWWIGDIQKQRKRIMCAIGNRYLKRNVISLYCADPKNAADQTTPAGAKDLHKIADRGSVAGGERSDCVGSVANASDIGSSARSPVS